MCSYLSAAVAAVLVLAAGPAASGSMEPGVLRLGTSEDLERLVRAWMAAYTDEAPAARTELHSPQGASASAFEAMMAGDVDAVVVGRPLREAEAVMFAARFGGPPLCFAVATPAPRGEQRAALAVLVHRTNPLRALTLAQLDAIFSAHRRRGQARISTWGDLGLGGQWAAAPVHAVAPDAGSGTAQYFREAVLWGAAYGDGVREMPRMSDAVVRAVAADPLALGVTTLNFGLRGTRALAVADAGTAFEPSNEHIAAHRYPLTRWTDLCLDPSQAKPHERAVHFARFVLDRKGQRIAAAQGFLPLAPATVQKSLTKLVAAAPQVGQPFALAMLDLQMAWIAPGEVLLGSPEDEPSRGTDEGPQTRVPLTRGFWMGTTEVTQRQWRAVMGTNPSRFVAPVFPVEQVSWRQAAEFARRIDARERAAGRIADGYAYALPTEAQWEYAAKAGATGAFAMNVDAFAWHDQNSGGSTHAVGTKQPNAWDLHDMLGNVWEWCADWYAPYPGGTAPDYAGPVDGAAKASRGGSWWAGPRGARPANRYRDMPQNGNDDLGFRLALVPSRGQPADESLPVYGPGPPVTGRLALAGADTMAPMVRRWIERFREHQPGVQFELASGAPPTAAAGLADGSATFGYTGRTLWEPEVGAIVAARGHRPTSFRVGAGAFDDPGRTHTMAVFVHADNPLRQLTLEQVEAVFAANASATTWGQLGLAGEWADRPIRAVVAKLGTGATNSVRDVALRGKPWSSSVREFATDEEAVAAFASDPSAICIAGLPYGTRAVRSLALGAADGDAFHAPTRDNVVARRYPLARLLYLHAVSTPATPLPLTAREFLRFVLSREGQELALEAGYLPLTADIVRDELGRLR